ncbi:MAG: flagellar hook-length control protein FliK [Solirubrobacteraceae bacterium]|nr:flagellar hook-length control protein FliK [Solirubrobacteraceae bacterium]
MSFGGGAIPIEFVLLRGSPLVDDLTLKPGSMINGRVLELLGNGRGFINLAGIKLEAQLPGTVRAGEILRMRVTESPDERLSLKIVDQFMPQGAQDASATAAAQSAAVGPQPLVGFGLPGGAQAQLILDDDGGPARAEGEPVRSIVLRYDSELLGRMDVVVRLDDAQVHATVLAMPGAPLEGARSHSDELRTALREAADRPAQVIIAGRALEFVDVEA